MHWFTESVSYCSCFAGITWRSVSDPFWNKLSDFWWRRCKEDSLKWSTYSWPRDNDLGWNRCCVRLFLFLFWRGCLFFIFEWQRYKIYFFMIIAWQFLVVVLTYFCILMVIQVISLPSISWSLGFKRRNVLAICSQNKNIFYFW